eukprot:365349-Chlamydomonas_euryale.AAC.2
MDAASRGHGDATALAEEQGKGLAEAENRVRGAGEAREREDGAAAAAAGAASGTSLVRRWQVMWEPVEQDAGGKLVAVAGQQPAQVRAPWSRPCHGRCVVGERVAAEAGRVNAHTTTTHTHTLMRARRPSMPPHHQQQRAHTSTFLPPSLTQSFCATATTASPHITSTYARASTLVQAEFDASFCATATTASPHITSTHARASTLVQAEFDAVVVCNGHYSEPKLPNVCGIDAFPGAQMHSHNYREPGAFRDQVWACGAGNIACGTHTLEGWTRGVARKRERDAVAASRVGLESDGNQGRD